MYGDLGKSPFPRPKKSGNLTYKNYYNPAKFLIL